MIVCVRLLVRVCVCELDCVCGCLLGVFVVLVALPCRFWLPPAVGSGFGCGWAGLVCVLLCCCVRRCCAVALGFGSMFGLGLELVACLAVGIGFVMVWVFVVVRVVDRFLIVPPRVGVWLAQLLLLCVLLCCLWCRCLSGYGPGLGSAGSG